MGNPDVDANVTLYLVANELGQIRHNALESARIVTHQFLEKKIGLQNYYMVILRYPHHVIREKPIATGAGADRYSQGMRLAFGRPAGVALQIRKKGTPIVMIKTRKEFLDIAKQALRKFNYKIPLKCSIEVSE